MTTSAGDPVSLELNGAETSRHSHRRSHRKAKKLAARVLLLLAIGIGILGTTDFTYHAVMHANCDTDPDAGWLGIRFSDEVCMGHRGIIDERLRYDASAAVVAAMLLIGSLEISRRIPKQRRDSSARAINGDQVSAGSYLHLAHTVASAMQCCFDIGANIFRPNVAIEA